MIAARIGPTGSVKPPSADAVANASGGALVVLAADVAVWDVRRDARLVNSVAVPSNGAAADPSPVASEAGEGAAVTLSPRMLRAEPLPDPAENPAVDELCCVAEELVPTTLRLCIRVAAVRGRAAADVTLVEATGDAADSADPTVSPSATGAKASAEPTPNIRASAPTRPTERACPDALRR